MKYVLVTGGVISGLGKGVTTSSIGYLLKRCGFTVTAIKIDPYLNMDAGTIAPAEHGEVFVLNDGGEVDLDLGTYERLLDVNLTKNHSITTGKIYARVLERERRGDFLGKTVQVVPHVTSTISEWIDQTANIGVDQNKENDICMIELGGTIGDIESLVFLEALSQIRHKHKSICHIHVALTPSVSGEYKTKPVQHSVRQLFAAGLPPDYILCRSKTQLTSEILDKISERCMVPRTNVFSFYDVSEVHMVPRMLLDQSLHVLVAQTLSLGNIQTPSIEDWEQLHNQRIIECNDNERILYSKIAVVGKYTDKPDTYLSITKAINHAECFHSYPIEIVWLSASDISTLREGLQKVDGIIVPGGFGGRDTEGIIFACEYARTKKVPFLGICLGMQLAVVDWCREIFGNKNINSSEFLPKDSPSELQVICEMPETTESGMMGGTMRLGEKETIITPNTLAYNVYQNESVIKERHRHRYEVNPSIVSKLEEAGLVFSGKDSSGKRMEIIEMPRNLHPFYLGVQFHPEFTSRPLSPSPPFVGLIGAVKYAHV